jgi:hypothetical protein
VLSVDDDPADSATVSCRSRPEKVCQLRDGTGGRNARIGFGIYKAIATESD